MSYYGRKLRGNPEFLLQNNGKNNDGILEITEDPEAEVENNNDWLEIMEDVQVPPNEKKLW